MAKGSGKKGSKKTSSGVTGPRQRAAKLEKALAAGLKREAKTASRLEATQLEVAVLRMALAEVVGEVPAEPAPAAAAKAPAKPATEKKAATPKRPAGSKPAAAAKAPAKPAPAPARARRAKRSGPAPADR